MPMLLFLTIMSQYMVEQVIFVGHQVDGLQGLRDGAGFDGAVADLCAADSAPHLMTADAGVENLWDRVKSQLGRFGDHHVHDAHQIVGGINGVEGVVVQEDVQSMRGRFTDAVGEVTCVFPGEMGAEQVFIRWQVRSRSHPSCLCGRQD